MNLAEALIIKNDICVEIAELAVMEYETCALIPPGEKPQKDPGEILESLQAKYDELALIEEQIKRTNKSCGINDLIVKRDQSRRQYRLLNIGYRAAFDKKIFNKDKFRVYKDLNGLRGKMNEALEQYRKYDILIQELNRKTQLIEKPEKIKENKLD